MSLLQQQIPLLLLVVLCGCAAQSAPINPDQPTASVQPEVYVSAVETLEFQALAATYTEAQIAFLLEDNLKSRPLSQRRAAAVLVSTGVVNPEDLASPELAQRKINQFLWMKNAKHPALFGKTGDADLLLRLHQELDYKRLLEATDVLEVLGAALADGVITGYDLRMAGVYDNFPPAQTFIYSHSSLLHIRQLVTLLRREGVHAWVYVTPKISAFLYREDWGSAGPNVVELDNGIRVVQGREMAVQFLFDTPDDRARFQSVVNRYAKRDSKEETGLIAGAWWQPFYYTDSPMEEFEPISLVVLTAGRYEATLTVTDEKTPLVLDALQDVSWPTRRDRVWVNPAFHRFLNGDYK